MPQKTATKAQEPKKCATCIYCENTGTEKEISTTFKGLLEYDLYYIKNLSLGMDLSMIFQTIKVVLFQKGAR